MLHVLSYEGGGGGGEGGGESLFPKCLNCPGGTPILGHIRDVQPEWVSFPGRKPADGCKCLTKNLRMGHNFDIILPGNG